MLNKEQLIEKNKELNKELNERRKVEKINSWIKIIGCSILLVIITFGLIKKLGWI